MKDITIGILAGMGAKSTAPFVDMVVDQCQALYGAKHDDEYPHMMIYSLPTPMYLDRPLEHDRLSAVIVEGMKRLESCGVDFIAMPCNTAHQYYDQLQAAIDVPMLNIIDETLKQLPEHANRVALLATEFTINAGIYQQGIEQSGREFVHQADWQTQVNGLLNGIKDNDDLEMLKQQWLDLLNQIKVSGVDLAIIACTDLNAVSRFVEPPMQMVDATEMLAKATVQRYLALTQVPA